MKQIPSEQWCRDKLIQLLETVDGERHHPRIIAFWIERAKACDGEEAEFNQQLFERLAKVWDELTTPPGRQKDIFSVFGMEGD